MIEVLNLGAGVQSTTVAMMVVHGELPMLDYAIFADTGWEPQVVYRNLDWIQGKLEAVGVKVLRVAKGNIKEDALRSQVRGKKTENGRWASMPYFVKGETDGMIRRQCTSEYKIQPIEKAIKRDILGIAPRKRWPTEPVIRRWYGISIDEVQRSRTAVEKWAVNYYPLIERRMTRQSCIAWMQDHAYPLPPRSACIACPYRHNSEWRYLRDNFPEEWQEAVEFDKAIRNCGGMRGQVFVHSSRVPLDEANIDRDSPGQLLLWQDECAGMCGV